jgi:hypothetical protein
MADESAGTGLAELDRALGGLYWGDWHIHPGVAAFWLPDALAMTNVLWCQT